MQNKDGVEMSLDKLKSGIKQYIETRRAPELVFVGFMVLIIIAVFPYDIVEKSLSRTGFRAIYALIACIVILIGNLERNTDKQEFNPEA